MSITKGSVKMFLDRFKNKAQEHEVVFVNREKNRAALLELDILPADRKHYLTILGVNDYSQGPLDDQHEGSDVWFFGKTIKGQEVYVKITLKGIDQSCVCISFHLAERPIDYPFKNTS